MNTETQIIVEGNGEEKPDRYRGLTPFQPGQSGNPDGMKPGTIHFNTLMRHLLNQETDVLINGQPFRMSRAASLMLEKIRLATNSPKDSVRLRAIMDIEDRMDGRPVSSIPASPEGLQDGVVFYIPNENSRKRIKK